MELNVGAEKFLEHSPVRKGNSKMASPEEGRRLVQAFLNVQRADLREEIIDFAERILQRQKGR